jgi:uncharacterized protein
VTDDEAEQIEEWALNALVVLFYLPVALGSLLFLFWSGGEFALWVRTLGEHPLRDVLVGALVGVGLVAVSRLFVLLGPGRRMADALGRVIGRPSLGTCLVLAASSAIGEELLFRAVLQPRLGVALATALFALAHLPYERDLWPWPLLAVAMGLALAGLYEWSGATLAPIVAHGVLNAANLRWLARRRAASGQPSAVS